MQPLQLIPIPFPNMAQVFGVALRALLQGMAAFNIDLEDSYLTHNIGALISGL
jgi:hypothetical protein